MLVVGAVLVFASIFFFAAGTQSTLAFILGWLALGVAVWLFIEAGRIARSL